jgi:hypothetical protein
MALDFTVVFSVRQRFGDAKIDDLGLETEAPFVGSEKEYPFSCPDVDPSQQAILLFQCMGANLQQSDNVVVVFKTQRLGPVVRGGVLIQ